MWLEGARLRTLPAAAAPVLIGIGAALRLDGFSPLLSILAMLVALSLQIAVNFSNDYSDGVRGTDNERVGPTRLTASGRVPARVVLALAFVCYGLAAVLGVVMVAVSAQWWLLLAGLAAVAAAWFYTGGSHPYGYLGVGLSELFVFVFFGLMATVATTWVQVQVAPWWLWLAAVAVGLESVALLFINNIRDLPTDSKVGKRTLPVRIGDRPARLTYATLVGLGVLAAVIAAASASFMAAGLAALALGGFAFVSAIPVLRGRRGHALLGSLRQTGILTGATGLFLAVFFAFAAS